MISIVKVDCITNEKYDYVKCPVCNKKIFDKPKNSKVSVLKMTGNVGGKMNHLLLECHRCKNKYLITTEE